MVAGVLKLRPVEAQAHQPHPEGKQLIIAAGLAHDGAALGDGLGGHGEAQVDVRRGPACMEGGVETAPLHRAAIEHRVQV